jgi:hypothetical protein
MADKYGYVGDGPAFDHSSSHVSRSDKKLLRLAKGFMELRNEPHQPDPLPAGALDLIARAFQRGLIARRHVDFPADVRVYHDVAKRPVGLH